MAEWSKWTIYMTQGDNELGKARKDYRVWNQDIHRNPRVKTETEIRT